jgi:alpha-L-rhamnosidase
LLGKPSDARRFASLADETATAFHRRFFRPEAQCYGNGTQTSCILPLAFGMAPDDVKAALFAHLVKAVTTGTDDHVGAGLVGCQYLLRVLSDNGRPDLAGAIATQTTYPSWGYMLSKGATTIWELWNGNTADPAMNSGNHLMLVGDLAIWLHEYLVGIRPDYSTAGFAKFVIRPEPVGDVTWARGSFQSVHGRIQCQWRREGSRFFLTATVPPNTMATVYVPALSPDAVTEGGRRADRNGRIKFLRQEAGRAVYETEPGRYEFQSHFTPPRPKRPE